MITTEYASPLGPMLLAADEAGLTGAWFEGQKYFARGLAVAQPGTSDVLAQATRWLDAYFSGREPDHLPPLRPRGSPFQLAVWRKLLEIPYGQTTTYGAVARAVAADEGRASVPAQAVGGAVGRNPLSVFIPCHRVVGASGSLTGYAGGLDRKIALLKLERCDMTHLPRPAKGAEL